MFLDVGNFCKAMKSAYNNGRLDVGYINEGLYISSGYWVVWINVDHVPNKIKALVVELAGDLPKWDSAFTISKSQPTPQTKLIDSTYYSILSEKDDAKNKLTITPISLYENGQTRVLQYLDGYITCVKEEYLAFIDPSAVDYDLGESQPIGPCSCSFLTGLYWYNDFGTVIIMPYKSKHKVLMDVLEFVRFKEDGKIERCVREVRNSQRETEENEEEPDSGDESELGEEPEQTEIQDQGEDDSEG